MSTSISRHDSFQELLGVHDPKSLRSLVLYIQLGSEYPIPTSFPMLFQINTVVVEAEPGALHCVQPCPRKSSACLRFHSRLGFQSPLFVCWPFCGAKDPELYFPALLYGQQDARADKQPLKRRLERPYPRRPHPDDERHVCWSTT